MPNKQFIHWSHIDSTLDIDGLLQDCSIAIANGL